MGHIRRDLNSALAILVVAQSTMGGGGRPQPHRRGQAKPRPTAYEPGKHPGWHRSVHRAVGRKWQALQARFGN